MKSRLPIVVLLFGFFIAEIPESFAQGGGPTLPNPQPGGGSGGGGGGGRGGRGSVRGGLRPSLRPPRPPRRQREQRPQPPQTPRPTQPSKKAAAPGAYKGPQTGNGAPPATQPSSNPNTGAPASATPTAATTPRTGGMVVDAEPENWLQWWQMNYSEFLQPNRLGHLPQLTTSEYLGTPISVDRLEKERKKALPLLLPFLDDEDIAVRQAATLAVGKIGGDEAVSELREMLGDESVDVRDAAVLGLGASGSEKALPILIGIAKTGNHPDFPKENISPSARSFAIAALGIAKKRGLKPDCDQELLSLFENMKADEQEEIGTAVYLYSCLAPSENLRGVATKTMEDRKSFTAMRCKATESLSWEGGSQYLKKLLNSLSDPQVEIRRSAAISLGTFPEASVIKALQAVLEDEKDEITRGFALISLGRVGGTECKKTLVQSLSSKSHAMRPWAALGIGIAARNSGDADLCKALRKGFEEENNHSLRGAYLLACGIAKDRNAIEILEKALKREKDFWMRSHASLALAMLQMPESGAALRERILEEKSSALRGTMALALGYLGERQDAALIAEEMKNLKDPAAQGLFALALAYHGTEESLKALQGVVEDPKAETTALTSAIQGLGVLLGGEPMLSLSFAARQSNFSIFPTWVLDLLEFTV